MSVLLFALGAAGLTATAALGAALTRQPGVVGFLLATYVLAVAEVVLVSLVLSPFRLVGAVSYITVEAVLLVAALLAWLRFGRPRPPALPARPREWRPHVVVAVLAGVVAGALLYALVVGLAVPPNNSDAMTYRLSRSAAWLQHGGLHWIQGAHTERQNEFPVNSELEVLYTFALLDSDRAAALPQFLAALALVVGVAGCARRLGYGRGAALFAGLLGPTLTEVALQSTNTQNDLVVASLVAAAAYFVQSPRIPDLALAGAAAGLAAGTKITAYLALPTIALLAVLALPRRRLPTALAAVAAGVALFAGSSIALNLAHTGKPFGHSAEQEIYRPTVTARGTVSTAARAVYRFVDFSGLRVPPEIRLPLEDAGEWTFEKLGIDPNPPESSATLFAFQLNLRAHEDHSFFGPLGIGLIPLSLGFLVAFVARRTTPRRAASATALPLFIVALAFVFRFDDEARYLLVPLALTLPLAATVYRSRLLAAAIAAVATVTVAAAHLENELKPTGLGDDRAAWHLSRPEAQSLDVPPRQPLLERIEALPADARIGVALSPSDWDYPVYGEALDRRLVPIGLECPVRAADRRRLRYLVLGAPLPWPGRHPGWAAVRFPRVGTVLVRSGPPASVPSSLPCFGVDWPR